MRLFESRELNNSNLILLSARRKKEKINFQNRTKKDSPWSMVTAFGYYYYNNNQSTRTGVVVVLISLRATPVCVRVCIHTRLTFKNVSFWLSYFAPPLSQRV